MTTFVLDTSVVVQWFEESGEVHHKKAKQILKDAGNGKVNLLIPDLLLPEVLNALLVGKKCTLEETNSAVKELFNSPLIIIAVSQKVLEQTSVLMKQYSLASYDAYFLALAKYEECVLISDDQKAHGKIKDENIIMLEDY